MRQGIELPAFTVILHRASLSLGLIVVLVAINAVGSGCKRRVTIEVPKAILEAKTATLDELLHIVNRYQEIQTLRSGSLKAEYASEEVENDQIELEKYPRAPGQILLKRPNSSYLVIQNPVLKKREVSLLSEGDEFRVWVHGKHTYYIGRNSAEELISDDLEENPNIPIRATHIFEAVLPEAIPMHDPTIRISMIEDQDESAKYYTLTSYREGLSPRLHPRREFRIERAGLTIARQRIFDDDGRVTADIAYSDITEYGNFPMPEKIHIERPLDGYTLYLEFKDWRINSEVEDDIFRLNPPEGVTVIRFK